MKHILIPYMLLLGMTACAQTNVRAWYAQGQVWVVWQTNQPFPETYGVFKKTGSFSNTAQATAIGRLFHYEYFPGTFWQQTGDTVFTYRIPKPDGTVYQLQPGEGLFVETVTSTGSAFYAVVEWGKPEVVAGVNITQNAVNYTFNPVAQPVNCHLQLATIGADGHKSAWFAMWALGKTEHWAGRPDFPVMANVAKNGMPSMFILSQALEIDTAEGKKIPMTHWLHGGGMYANQFMPAGFKVFNIAPQQGVSVSHNDDFPVKTTTDGDSVFTAGRSLWFGWTKNHDPFDYHFSAAQGDTVINYTQRRIMWINDWLIRHFPIDPDRVAVQGYSMGSGGATVLTKTFPDKISTACLFNCGLRGAVDSASEAIVGSVGDNLPTNLRGFNGEVIHMNDVFELNSRLSSSRDLPIIRIWNGKNDPNERMHWGPDMVAQIRMADSLGWGIQFHWDERIHVYSVTGMHWIQGFPASEQTYRDNLAYQEDFNSKQSFPAFFNHRLEPLNNDPGIGIFGINNGDGDNWGAWGGWHNWDLASMVDEPGKWEVTAWLTGDAAFANDICPENALLSDMAIRKPQQFKPSPGKTLEWRVRDVSNNQVIQAGQTTVLPDGLVVVPQIFVTKETFRTIRIQVYDPTVPTQEAGEDTPGISIHPNPSTGILSTNRPFDAARVFDLNGKTVLEKHDPNTSQLDVSSLPNGLYFLEIQVNNQFKTVKFVKNQ